MFACNRCWARPDTWLCRRAGYVLLFTLLSSLLTTASAAERAPTTLTLAEALARVLRASPELAVFPYEARAAEARALQAGRRPNPELSIEVENVTGSGNLADGGSMETTLALSQVVEMGGKRGLRRDVGRWRQEALEQDYELARLDVLAAAASRYLEVVQARRLLDFAEQAADWTQAAEDVVRRKFEAGGASRAELSRARTDVMRAELAVDTLEVELANARRRLASLWGETEPDFGEAEAALFALAPLPDFERLQTQLEQAPQLQRFLTLERLRQAEVDLAVARARQNIEVGVGLKHVQEADDVGLVLELSMPLGVFDRNQGNIAAAREDLAKLDLQEKVARVKVITELRNAHARLKQARKRVGTLRGQILPEAERALELIQQGYSDGRFSYLELVEARQELLAVKNEAVVAATDFHQTLITLESLTGQPLTEQASPTDRVHAGAVSGIPSVGRLPTLDDAGDQGSDSQQGEMR